MEINDLRRCQTWVKINGLLPGKMANGRLKEKVILELPQLLILKRKLK
jgi:hypothetical protein